MKRAIEKDVVNNPLKYKAVLISPKKILSTLVTIRADIIDYSDSIESLGITLQYE